MSTDPDLRVLSLGGGTQSSALALMSAAGDLPRLDHIIFADTQGEMPETYAFIDYLRTSVERAGIPLHVVTAGNLEEDLKLDHAISRNPTPPAHVINPDGIKGRIGAYRCSFDYKRRMIERTVKQLCGQRGAWKSITVEQWIGFSLEETGRMRQAEECRCGHPRVSKGKEGYTQVHTPEGCSRCGCTSFSPWQVNRWPLVDMGMTRADTIAWFGAHGHPTPPRSACFFCPNQGQRRWQALKARGDDLWERACDIDETIRDGGGFNRRGQEAFRAKLFLHNSVTPLRTADLRTKTQVIADSGQGSLFDDSVLASDCEAGVCFT